MSTQKQIEPGYYKYVHLEDNSIVIGDIIYNHDRLIPEGKLPVSAGFVSFHDIDYIRIEGNSQTLKLVPSPEDADLILKHIKSGGKLYEEKN